MRKLIFILVLLGCLPCVAQTSTIGRATVNANGTVTVTTTTVQTETNEYPIVSAPAPAPAVVTAPLTTLADIQAASSALWKMEGGACCGTATAGTSESTLGNPSPSLSGGSIELASSGGGYNVQVFYDPGCANLPGGTCTGFTHIEASAYTYIPSSSAALQGIEGPDVVIYTGKYELYPSLQCATNSASKTPSVPTWNLYSMTAHWVSTNISCASYLSSRDTWHHIELTDVLDFAKNTMDYDSLLVDGVQIFSGLTGFSSSGRAFTGLPHFRPQYQLDSKSGAGTTKAYIDHYTLKVW